MSRAGVFLFFGVLLSGTTTLVAQDSPLPEQPVAEALRARVAEAFLQRALNELSLTPDQRTKMEQVVRNHGQARLGLDREARQFRNQLNLQLRPGVAANPVRVNRLVDGLGMNGVAYAETFRAEMRDLSPILTPVQRGQYQLLRDQFLLQLRNVQQLNQPGRAVLNAGGRRGGNLPPRPKLPQ